MKKLFSFKAAKWAVMICTVPPIFIIVILGLFFSEGGLPDYLFGSLFTGMSEFIATSLEHLFNTDLLSLEVFLPMLMLATLIIKILDYIFTIVNYPDGQYSGKEMTKKHRVFNVLGIIVLPVWTYMSGSVFYMINHYITDEVYQDFLFSPSFYNSALFTPIQVITTLVLFVLPTLCVFVYSLALDILGLKTAQVHHPRSDIMKKLFSFKVAKWVLIIGFGLLALQCLLTLLFVMAGADGEADNMEFLYIIFGTVPKLIADRANEALNIDITEPAYFVLFASVFIKPIDYIFTIKNYPNKTMLPTLRVLNILGLIVTPIWAMEVYILFRDTTIASNIYHDLSIPSSNVFGKLILVIILFFILILPTIIIIAYSLVLDILGLKASQVHHPKSDIMKKLFSFKVAKWAVIILTLLAALFVYISVHTYHLDPHGDGDSVLLSLLWGAFPFMAQDVLDLSYETVATVEVLSPYITFIVVCIKLADYSCVILNYPDEPYSDKKIMPRHKVASILGIIALPAWCIITGYIFLVFTNGIMSPWASLICSVLLMLCVFVYSLALDIYCLRSGRNDDGHSGEDNKNTAFKNLRTAFMSKINHRRWLKFLSIFQLVCIGYFALLLRILSGAGLSAVYGSLGYDSIIASLDISAEEFMKHFIAAALFIKAACIILSFIFYPDEYGDRKYGAANIIAAVLDGACLSVAAGMLPPLCRGLREYDHIMPPWLIALYFIIPFCLFAASASMYFACVVYVFIKQKKGLEAVATWETSLTKVQKRVLCASAGLAIFALLLGRLAPVSLDRLVYGDSFEQDVAQAYIPDMAAAVSRFNFSYGMTIGETTEFGDYFGLDSYSMPSYEVLSRVGDKIYMQCTVISGSDGKEYTFEFEGSRKWFGAYSLGIISVMYKYPDDAI